MSAKARFLYCGCGVVFHAETARDGFDQHIAESGHQALAVAQVDRYVDRICQVCLRARGVWAFGRYQLTSDSVAFYSWVCKRCVAELVGLPSSAT